MSTVTEHPANPDAPPAMLRVPRRRFSQELQALALKSAGRPTRLSDILQATQGREFDLFLVCISLPFVTPIPLPGLSAPFGLAVALIGARLAAGRKPWLPKRLLARDLPPRFLTKLLNAASRIVRLLEFCLRPRMAFLHEVLVFRRVAGALIMLSGLLMVLPVPLPLSNSLPAWTVLLLAAGALERDGASFLAGCLTFLASVGYFVFLALGGAHVIEALKRAVLGA